MDPITLHSRALAHLRAVAAAVPDDAWDTTTNCDPWSAATLLNHTLASQLLWVGAVTGTERIGVGEVMKPEPLTGDRLATVDAVIDEATRTWAQVGVLDRDITGAFGTLPGRDTIVFCTIDPLAHAWDLAVSVGVDAELPDDLLTATDDLISRAVNDTTRQFGLFKEEAPVGPDASVTDRVMARAGRRRP